MPACPLCGSETTFLFHKGEGRDYLRCRECELIFAPKQFHLSTKDEKERYSKHNNVASDSRYLKYLSKVADFVEEFRGEDSKILDFGCGESAVLEYYYKTLGIQIDSYDPMYGIGLNIQSASFDIVIMCEVIEHLCKPKKELEFINSILKPNGKIFIRTSLYDDSINFESWWYKLDPTHIIFLSGKTVDKIREMYPNLKIYIIA